MFIVLWTSLRKSFLSSQVGKCRKGYCTTVGISVKDEYLFDDKIMESICLIFLILFRIFKIYFKDIFFIIVIIIISFCIVKQLLESL